MRGRPPDMQKHAKILASAREILARVHTAPGIDTVARRAGVSKLTIYRHFGSFENLVRAVLRDQQRELMAHADNIPRVSTDLRRTLVETGERLLAFLTSDEGLTLLRVTSNQVARRQGLGRVVFEGGPRTFVARIARLLRAAGESAELEFAAPAEAAEQLVGMWLGVQVTGLMMQGCPKPTSAQLRRRSTRAVDAFLRAYAASR